MIRLDDLGEQADNTARRVEFSTALAFAHGKFAKEIFVNTPKRVVVHRGGDF